MSQSLVLAALAPKQAEESSVEIKKNHEGQIVDAQGKTVVSLPVCHKIFEYNAASFPQGLNYEYIKSIKMNLQKSNIGLQIVKGSKHVSSKFEPEEDFLYALLEKKDDTFCVASVDHGSNKTRLARLQPHSIDSSEYELLQDAATNEIYLKLDASETPRVKLSKAQIKTLCGATHNENGDRIGLIFSNPIPGNAKGESFESISLYALRNDKWCVQKVPVLDAESGTMLFEFRKNGRILEARREGKTKTSYLWSEKNLVWHAIDRFADSQISKTQMNAQRNRIATLVYTAIVDGSQTIMSQKLQMYAWNGTRWVRQEMPSDVGKDTIDDFSFSADGTKLLIHRTLDETVYVLQERNNSWVPLYELTHDEGVECASFLKTDDGVISVSDKKIFLWDLPGVIQKSKKRTTSRARIKDRKKASKKQRIAAPEE